MYTKKMLKRVMSLLLSIELILTGMNLSGYGKMEVYAAVDEEVTVISQVEISDITEPSVGGELDTEAVCNTSGVKTTNPLVSYTKNGGEAAGEIGYLESYKATIELEADSENNYAFSSETKATVNGKDAIVDYSSETGKIAVTYTFKTPAKTLENVYYVTPNELMTGFCLDGSNDFYGILNYGRATGSEKLYKESVNNGEALQWYIVGRDSANSKDNIVLLSAEEFGTCSAVDQDYYWSTLRSITSQLYHSGRFSGAEKKYMVSSYLSKSGVSDIVYPPYAEKFDDYITLGGQDNLMVSSSNLPEMTESLLTRNMYWVNSYRWFQVHIGKGTSANGISGKGAYFAAFDLDISDVLFASAAPVSQETTSFATAKASFINDTVVDDGGQKTYVYKDYNLYTLRMKNNGKKIFSDIKRYDNKVVVTKGTDVSDLFLYVQDENSVYSKKIQTENGEVTTINLEDMTGIESLNESTTRVWLETTEDCITYAKKASRQNEVSLVAVNDIDAPDIGKSFDITAKCITDGILEDAPVVTWTNGAETVSGSAEYNTAYTANVILSLDTERGYNFADDIAVTVNGKSATSVRVNNDNKLTITYSFPATGKKERTITITADNSEHIYSGEPVNIVTTPTISEGDGSVSYTYYMDEACTEKTHMSEPIFMMPGEAPVAPGIYWVKATVSANGIYDTAISNAVRFEIKKKPITSISIKNQTIAHGEDIAQYSRTENSDAISISGLCEYDYIDEVTLKASTLQITNCGEITYTGLKIKSNSRWNMSFGEEKNITDYYDFTNAKITKGKLEVTGIFDISNGDIIINTDSYTIGDETVPYTTDYVITGNTNRNKIKVVSGSHKITIQDLTIDLSGCGDNQIYKPIDFGAADESELVIKGTNTVKGGGDCPGINVPTRKKLVISGDGTLNAYGGRAWPGIGTGGRGNIEIQSGIINANGGSMAAGIGGSQCQDGGTIAINGGEVTALGGMNQYGSRCSAIGGGCYSEYEADISIAGGIVHSFTSVSRSKIKLGNATMKMNSDSELEFVKSDDKTDIINIVKIKSGSVELSGDANGYVFDIPENSGNIEITLNNFVNDSYIGWQNTLEIGNGSNLTLKLADKTENTIYCGAEASAIRVNETASLTIEGNGTLKAGIHNGSSLAYCAVIGSGYCGNYGNITINGGEIYADSPACHKAAAIGTARWNGQEGTSNGIITLNGGKIHANQIGGVDTAEYSTVKGSGGAIVYTDEISAAQTEFAGVIVNSSNEYNIVGDTSNLEFIWTDDYKCSATYIHKNADDQTVVESKECDVTSKTVQNFCEREGTITYTAIVTFGEDEFTDTATAVAPAKAHTYKKVLEENATCTKDGYYKRVCEVCGYEPKDGWSSINTRETGIGTNGKEYQVSSDETKLFSKEIDCYDMEFSIRASIGTLEEADKENYTNAQRYDEYVTLIDYTADASVRKIKLIGDLMYEGCVIRINGQEYDRNSEIEVAGNHILIDMKLSNDSSLAYVDGMFFEVKKYEIPESLKIPATGHNIQVWEKNDSNTHKGKCSKCGEIVTEAHSWDGGTITVAAAPGVEGTKTYTCTACGQTRTETIPALPQERPHDHSYGNWQQNDANTHKKVCAGCGDVITEAHNWDDGIITVVAAPGVEGTKTYTCTVCGQTKTETIPALPQENQHVHSYGAWEQNDANTHKKVCTGCGDVITEVHSWDSGTITVSATQETEGIKTYTCTVCGQNKIETIPKLAAQETVTNDDVVDDDLEQPDEEEEEETDDSDESAALAVGTTITDTSSKAKYVVVDPKTFGYTSRDIHAVVYKVPTDKKRKDVSIPNDISVDGLKYVVVAIADSAFKNNTKLEKLTIGNNVKTIGNSAFAGCSKLKTVGFRNTSKVQSIGKKAFYKCTKISTITIPKSVVIISDSAFENCSALASIKTQSGSKLKSLGKATLKKCTSLKSITLPANIETIGSNAFYNCSKLQTIVIKSTKLKSVGANAFKGIKSNAKIKVPSKKLSAYKKLLKGKGQGKNVKITK